MTIRSFVPWPDQRLRTAAAEVDDITEEIQQIWADMVETMDAMPGVGLAAPQIGVMLQLAVVDASPDRTRRILMANPILLSVSDAKVAGEEASPNLPGVSAKVERPNDIAIRFLNADGVIERRDLTGLEARSAQHQIDHLQGRMYFENLSAVKRDMLLRRAKKSKGQERA